MPKKWYDATIVKVVNETQNTERIWIKIDSEEVFQFTPGQFVTLDLPIGEKRLERWRSYSIASNSYEDNTIELCIVAFEDGKGSSYITNRRVGDKLQLKGPEGAFILSDDLSSNLVLICTGTGIAPFRAMIQDRLKNNQTIHLIFGTRTFDDILYHEDMKAWSEFPNFKYDIVLSREKREGFSYGYVHSIYEDKYRDIQDSTHFYICGWSQMVDQAVKTLGEMGYPRNQIHYELYG